MPRTTPQDTAVTTTGNAQGRFSVQLSSTIGDRLDVIGQGMSDAVFAVARVQRKLSRPEVIESLVATYEAVQAEAAAEAAADTGNES